MVEGQLGDENDNFGQAVLLEPDEFGDAPVRVSSIAASSWNVFRYVGDLVHLGGVCVLFLTIAKNKTVTGFSRKTQLIYCMIFVLRYLDLFDHHQAAYLVCFKVTYIASSALALFLFSKFRNSYEAHKDTMSLTAVLLPCFIASLILTNDYSIMEIAWTYSEFLEGFSMVPQYIFSYRDGKSTDKGVLTYICCIGSYRVFYALNWIYKKIMVSYYNDIQSWIGGIVEILFFLDFLNFRLRGSSILRSLVLKVDDKINEVQEHVEYSVLGREKVVEGGELRRRRASAPKEEDDDNDFLDV